MKKIVVLMLTAVTCHFECIPQSEGNASNTLVLENTQVAAPSLHGNNRSVADNQRILYPDTKWSVLETNTSGWPPAYINDFQVDGDTLINSLSYYKIYCGSELRACLREADMKIYGYFIIPNYPNDKEKLLYDFDSWYVGKICYYDLAEESPERAFFDIWKLEDIRLDDGNCYQIANDRIINTVGSLSGILEIFYPSPTCGGSQSELNTYYRNGMQIYDRNKNYLSSEGVKNENTLVYTDENGQLVFDFRGNDAAGINEILIYTAGGQLLQKIATESENRVTVPNLQKGMYFYRILYSDANKHNCGKIIK